MYIFAIVFVIGEEKTNVQITLGAIAVFCSWINLILYLQWFSLFGIYVVMTQRVFLTVCKVSSLLNIGVLTVFDLEWNI